MRLNKVIIIILFFISSLFLFRKPQLATDIVPCEPKWQYEMPVAWLEKRDEALEYWLKNQKKK